MAAAGLAVAGFAGAGLADCAVWARKGVDPHHTVAINNDENSAPNRSEFISRHILWNQERLTNARSIIIKYHAIRNEIGNLMAVQAYGRQARHRHDVIQKGHLVEDDGHEDGAGLTIEAVRISGGNERRRAWSA